MYEIVHIISQNNLQHVLQISASNAHVCFE